MSGSRCALCAWSGVFAWGTNMKLGRFPAPPVVVPAHDVFATTGHPRCSVVALATEFAGLVAVAAVGLRLTI